MYFEFDTINSTPTYTYNTIAGCTFLLWLTLYFHFTFLDSVDGEGNPRTRAERRNQRRKEKYVSLIPKLIPVN